MRYHIVKLGDNVDKIINMYGITYQNYINLNGNDLKRNLDVGEKIKIGDIRRKKIDSITKINDIYIDNQDLDFDYQKYICPHCKNVIIIPK
jgi:hypothetical protein